MQRAATILTQLETCLSAAPEALARRLGVGVRTVATEVAALNQSLGRTGSVRLTDGRYRLLVVDAEAYREIRDRITGEQESFNDPDRRSAFILAKLTRSDVPVRTEELAAEMCVARSTLSGDIAHLRNALADSEVSIEGRPHVGLRLHGPELAIRTLILRDAYPAAYGTFLIGPELEKAFNDAADEFGFTDDLRASLLRWFTVMLDRTVNGHWLTEAPEAYSEIEGTQAHAFATALARRIAPLIDEDIPTAEILFLALPAAGRRTPTTADLLAVPSAPPVDVDALVEHIFGRIRHSMDLGFDVEPSELVVEFSHHIAYMINRLRYSLHVDRTVDEAELRGRFPVAIRMAEVARDVIAEETGLIMDGAELGLAATYFQVLLEDHAARQHRPFTVAILTGQGPGAARLIRGQLSKLLPQDTSYAILSLSSEPPQLDGIDLVVTTPGSQLHLATPTLELSEVFDRGELIRKLSAMRFTHHGPLALSGESGSMLVSLLDEERFVQLPADSTSADGVSLLVDRLAGLGMVNEAFRSALTAREALAPMQINTAVAFPHASAPDLQGVACALGVIPRGDTEDGLRIIFLMAVPAKTDYDDRILIRVYDEIIRLSQDPLLVRKVSRLTSYVQFFYLMEDYTEATTQGRH
jgi:transcriptional antiterminator/mannitol/fructose-specific phosphotransferase system IIA component (Ntr-type)